MVTTTATGTLQLLAAYRDGGDARAREQLVVNYMPLVRSLCRRFHSSREPQDDLFQTGMVGLLNAIAKFDPDRGTSFASLAIPEVLGAILNHLRDHGSLMKVPRNLRRNKLTVDKTSESLASSLGHWPTAAEVACACGLSEKDVQEAGELSRTGDSRSLDERVESLETEEGVTLSEYVGCEEKGYDLSLDRLTLTRALCSLYARERTILMLRFYKELSQRQIAERIQVSQMHVSRLERGALQKLRQVLQRSSGALCAPPLRL